MKKILILMCVIVSCLSAIEIQIAYENKEQPLYYMGNTNEVLENPGVAVEIVLELEEEIPGLIVVLQRKPWKRCLTELKLGKLDGIFNASYKQERESIGIYPRNSEGMIDSTKRITKISYCFYKNSDFDVDYDGISISDFDGKILAPRGYSIVGDLSEMGFEMYEVNDSKQIINLLNIGRFQLAALQDVTADSIIKKENIENVIKIDTPIKRKNYYLLLSYQFVEKNPELAQEIWDAIEKIRIDKMDKIIQKY